VIDDAFRDRRRALLMDAYARARPHVVITELFPFGRRQLRFELIPMLEAVEANTGECPGVTLADHGYLSEATLEELDRRGQRCCGAAP